MALRLVLTSLCYAMVATALVSCDLGGPTTRKWTEDVLLNDGTTITVSRTAKIRETAALGGGAYNAVEIEATIAFTGDHAKLPAWSQPLMAMVLYQDPAQKGQWVIVASTTSCDVWDARGKPKPPYWEYRLTSNGWLNVPLSTSSIGRESNLFKGYNRPFDPPHVSPVMRQFDDMRAVKEYQRVIGVDAIWSC